MLAQSVNHVTLDNLSIPTTFSKVHPSPLPAPPHLPPLLKVMCCRPKKFGRLPEGLPHYYPLDPHQPFQNRTIPRLAPHSCHMNALPVSHPSETLGVQLRASMPVPCQRELDCDKAISYYKLQHSAISSTLIFAQPYLSQD